MIWVEDKCPSPRFSWCQIPGKLLYNGPGKD